MIRLWQRIRNLLQVQRIRNRVLIAMIAVSIPSLIVLGVVSFNISKDTILDINTRMTADNLRTSSDMADLLFNNINNLNRAFVLDQEMRHQLRASNEGSRPNQRLEIQSTMQRVMNSNLVNTVYVHSVCLINLDFDIFCLGRSDDFSRYKSQNWQEEIIQEEWFQRMVDARGRTTYVNYNVIEDVEDTFSTVKLFRDADTIEGNLIGYLVINISKKIFDDIFNNHQNSLNSIAMVMDTSGEQVNLIYQSYPLRISQLGNGDLNSTWSRLEQAGYNIAAYVNSTTDWMLLYLTEIYELLKDSHRIGTFTVIILSVIALVALLLSYIISGGIITPLIKLKQLVVDWSSGKQIQLRKFGNDEIGVLSHTFQRVICENQDLNDRLYNSYLKEREAELRALQAQINPHFLYNTLDSIYWMAMLDHHEKIAQMAISLSESFKLSLNKGKETILIHKELMHIKHYLTIQNIRYNNRFTYIEDVEESLMSIEILKLLLQPLVENAITHGLEPKVGEGTIILTGRKEGDKLVFVVEDDGVGIADPTKIEQGYGIRNVRERLLLYYGESSSFEITSELNKGTSVQLSFNPNHRKGVHT